MADSSILVALEMVDNVEGITSGSKQASLARLGNLLTAVASGAKRARSIDIWKNGADLAYAYGTVVCAAVDVADTVSINGQALTATQHHSTGTVTLANVSADDTVTINGTVLTAKASPSGEAQFSQAGTDTEDAESFVSKVNAHSTLSLVVSASNAAGVVTLRAVTAGTDGDSITLESSNGTRLAVSGANLTGGAAVANNEFDPVGTNTETATALAAALNASTSAIVANHIEACNFSGSFAVASAAAGNYAEITLSDGRKWRFVGGTDWTVTGTDTQDGDSLALAINGTNSLNREVVAINTTGTVRIYQRRGTTATVTLAAVGSPITVTQVAARDRVLVSATLPGVAGNAVTLASSDGTDLAVSGARLTGGTGGNVSKVSFRL